MKDVSFVVITKIKDTCGGDGNFADAFVTIDEKTKTLCVGWDDDDKPYVLSGVDLVIMKQNHKVYEIERITFPVFYEGEILIVDKSSKREIVGRLRNITKWDVEWEEFGSLVDAIKRAKEVIEGEM